jgi:hypothetical protein
MYVTQFYAGLEGVIIIDVLLGFHIRLYAVNNLYFI